MEITKLTYDLAVKLLQAAKAAQMRLPMLISMAREHAEAIQRLTASYGEVCISGRGGLPTSAAQRALEATEEMHSRATAEIDKTLKLLSKATELVRRVPDQRSRDVLELHYIAAWSYPKIASVCRVDVRTIIRRHNAALQALHNMIDQSQ